MEPGLVVDIFREALMLAILIIAVIVLPALGVGLIVSMFQAATQINEQTLSFIPRLFAVFVAFIVAGPWLLHKVINYTITLFENIHGYL